MTLPDMKKFYINGAWVDATDRRQLVVTNPATGERVTTVSLGNEADVELAVAAARRALPALAATEMAERRAMLQRIRSAFVARIDDFAQAIMLELGTPIDLARDGQAAGVLGKIDAFIEATEQVTLSETLTNGDRVLRQPAGVAALIAPWNWPLHQIMLKVGAALAAGCPMILKPSEVTPICATLLAEVMDAAELAPGVFNMIHGDGPVTGSALCGHRGVDLISFTGSTGAGRQIALAAADGVKRCALELGGKSACLIFADANLDAALGATLRKAFNNSGQNCNAPTRILVERSVYEDAVLVAAELAKGWKVGQPDQPGTHIGPVANARQHEHVRAMIQSGLDAGARLVAGGAKMPAGFEAGYFVQPTVLADVDNDMEVARTEIFGPVVVMIPFESEAEALAIANDSDYGLAAFAHTADAARAERLILNLEAGMVLVNGADIAPGSPFGGVKQSGLGREGGKFGIEEFMEVKLVAQPQVA